MSDPDRLLDHAVDLEARLLSSALDEPPPPELLARTLQAVGVAGAGAAVATSSAATGAGVTAAAKTAGAGILGAIGIGAVAGVLVVGGFELATSRRDPPPARAAPTASPAMTGSRSEPHAGVLEPQAVPVVTAAPSPEGRSRSAPSATPAASGPRPSTLAAELALLDEARSALHRGDPARAEALLDRYARELPGGQMAREAAVLRADVEAAIDGGKTNP